MVHGTGSMVHGTQTLDYGICTIIMVCLATLGAFDTTWENQCYEIAEIRPKKL